MRPVGARLGRDAQVVEPRAELRVQLRQLARNGGRPGPEDLRFAPVTDLVQHHRKARQVQVRAQIEQRAQQRVVDLAEKHDLEIVARLDHPPAWSRSRPQEETGPFAPPDRVSDYGDYVAAVAERYRGRIRYYQLWNEPNIYPEWGEQAVDPVAYTEMLRVAYERAKEADPNVYVIAAPLAVTLGGALSKALRTPRTAFRPRLSNHFVTEKVWYVTASASSTTRTVSPR